MAKSKPAGYESKFNAGLVEGLKVVFRPGKLPRKEPEGAGYVKSTGLQQKGSGRCINNISTLLQKGQGLVNESQGNP